MYFSTLFTSYGLYLYIPNAVLLDYIDELAKDGYVKHYIRHVVLTAKAYSYYTVPRHVQYSLNKNIVSHFLGTCTGVFFIHKFVRRRTYT
nr:MAG TPA: hypothetical protein [Caudoviricetes sp.]